jgi:transcription elongation GreA/GreB family factor
MDTVCPSSIGALVGIWRALHKDLSVEMDPTEGRYLQHVVYAMDDELVAALLAAKLAMSKPPSNTHSMGDLVRRGSQVLYSVQGRRHRARLVHGSAREDGLLGVDTRFGAALLGLRSGHSLLWPHEHGQLVEVHALEVANERPRIGGTSKRNPQHVSDPCASG